MFLISHSFISMIVLLYFITYLFNRQIASSSPIIEFISPISYFLSTQSVAPSSMYFYEILLLFLTMNTVDTNSRDNDKFTYCVDRYFYFI